MIIQTDIYSLVGVALGALLIGGVITWLLLRRRKTGQSQDDRERHETFFLLFSRLTHSFKTSSAIIKGHLANLDKARSSDPHQWDVSFNAIKDQTESIDRLVQRLELTVRLGMPGNRLIMEPVIIPRLLEDTMVDLAPEADSKGIVLGGVVNTTGKGSDYVVSGDTLALKEVFSMVLENAVKHNGRGTEITAEVTKNGDFIQVDIADTGKGFSEAAKGSVFHKGNTQYRPRFKNGVGMGLYLCKLLVDQHGGQIEVETGEAGTRVHICLPNRRNARMVRQAESSNL